jgi:hypothetical protein
MSKLRAGCRAKGPIGTMGNRIWAYSARAWCDSIADRAGIARDGYWANWKNDCIASAQAALTECGALEVLASLSPRSTGAQAMSDKTTRDRIEFSLRDAGFDYDEAFRIAALATQPVAWRFWRTGSEVFNDHWTAWSADESFRRLCEKMGFKAEFAYHASLTQPGAGEMPAVPGCLGFSGVQHGLIESYGRQCFAAGVERERAKVEQLERELAELRAKGSTLPDGWVKELEAERSAVVSVNHDIAKENASLRGLAKWASGRLIDAGDAESAQQVLDLAGQGAADDSAATIAGLRRFAQRVMESWPEGDVDGGYLQDTAVECGLLAPVMVSERCGEGCRCVEYGLGLPIECFRKTPLLLGDGPVQAAEDIAGLRADAERYRIARLLIPMDDYPEWAEEYTGLCDTPEDCDDYFDACIAARTAQAAAGDAKEGVSDV